MHPTGEAAAAARCNTSRRLMLPPSFLRRGLRQTRPDVTQIRPFRPRIHHRSWRGRRLQPRAHQASHGGEERLGEGERRATTLIAPAHAGHKALRRRRAEEGLGGGGSERLGFHLSRLRGVTRGPLFSELYIKRSMTTPIKI
jgi:hypothetical protein